MRLAITCLLWFLGGAVASATELGIDGSHFTLDGHPTFLLGLSYYGALGATRSNIERDLQDMRRTGFNWIRVWATWGAFGNNVSAVGESGDARQPYMAQLQWLVERCDQLKIVVDVTLSRGGGVNGPPRLQARKNYLTCVSAVVRSLKPWRNWYLDLANERNIRDKRFASIEDLKLARQRVRELDPDRLVTASHAGDLPEDTLRDYLLTVKLDFIAPHRPRNSRSPRQTAEKTRSYLAWMAKLGVIRPVHYQEPFRRGYSPRRFEPTVHDFLEDLKQAVQGGAAGWCLHNGDQKDRPEGRPRRSFDMRQARLFEQLDEQEWQVVRRAAAVIAGH